MVSILNSFLIVGGRNTLNNCSPIHRNLILLCLLQPQMIDNKKDIILLDVRDSEEFETGHIPGAINISRGSLDFKVHLIIPDKTKRIIVYCGLDLRSPLATKSLNDLGYKKAINMIGGLRAWKEAGYPVLQ